MCTATRHGQDATHTCGGMCLQMLLVEPTHQLRCMDVTKGESECCARGCTAGASWTSSGELRYKPCFHVSRYIIVTSHVKCWPGHPAQSRPFGRCWSLSSKLSLERLQVVQALVAAGSPHESPGSKDQTPLHSAALGGQLEVCK